jgi:hypothetical protein
MSSLNETIALSGAKSLDVRLNIYSNDKNLSPMIQLDGTRVITVSNKINNPSVLDNNAATDEEVIVNASAGIVFNVAGYFTGTNLITFSQFRIGRQIIVSGTTSNNITTTITDIDLSASPYKVYVAATVTTESPASTTVKQYSTFVDEISPDSGSAEAKYLSAPVILEEVASALKILYAANIPPLSEVDLYYRAATQSAIDPLSKKKWVKVPTVYRKTTNKTDFTDQEYDIPNLGGFNVFQVKLVMRSTDQSQVPKIKDLRVIALA